MEEETKEAFLVRCQLVRLLVAGITVGRREDGRADVRVTYRFREPPEDLECMSSEENDKAFQVTMSGGDSHTFDSVKCAMHALARPVSTAASRSLATAWRRTAAFSAALPARAWSEPAGS